MRRKPKLRVFGAVGTIVELDGQRYELIRFEPYTAKTGHETTLVVWRTACATCSIEFEATQPIGSVEFNRRCAEHRQPGKRVRPAAPPRPHHRYMRARERREAAPPVS